MGEEEKEQPQVAPEPAKPKAAAKDLPAIVEAWFQQHFHNNWVAGNTLLYNKLHEAKQDLLARLK